MRWFAFNGDADGICSMVQWGLVHGVEGNSVTGVKRDIELLANITPESGDEIICMDISLARNHSRARELCDRGFKITWFDHHLAGEPIEGLDAHIDTSSNVCTAKIVENFLGVKSEWAEVALHGDGLSVHSSRPDFKELGELLNYNGYGADLDDLHFHPDKLMRLCLESKTPEKFLQTPAFETLKKGFADDMRNVESINEVDGIYLLPNEAWARRVVGVMAHRINSTGPGPHVIAIDKGNTLQVSLRGNDGIGDICSMFGGGGRATAGGIDALPKEEITALMNEVNSRRSA
ncbi:DHH family phosphoesterase [bacterium]|nr:DHH family phosphoesterase [bacterium]MDC3339695.1 DHH family phosphoesterase [bacterium]